jgi:hypothetical protein
MTNKTTLTAEEYQNIKQMSANLLLIHGNDKKGKVEVNKLMRTKFINDGMVEPKCVNPGCVNKVTCRNWGNWSFKSECSGCMTSRKNKRFVVEDGFRFFLDKKGNKTGVIMHKETFCENHDGHLGFECPVPHSKWLGFESGLDLDHVDGNHYNNDPENVRTYCKLCHGRKSIKSGDCSSKKSSARNFNVV